MIDTKLSRYLGIKHPILQAPMAFCAGGALAAAVSEAGGLGFIGGAYGDRRWISEQFDLVGGLPVGCGFITWSLAKKPELLDLVIDRQPAAIFLSFGDPAPFANRIKDAGIALICQVQTLRDAQHALDIGANIVVAQGSEAGGHGGKRSTFTLVPEIADCIARLGLDTPLCAAGGIADGRGLAAALMLGADGVLIGSRFWAASETVVHPGMHDAVIGADGDQTIRTSVVDVVRKLDWPDRYDARVMNNAFVEQWHEDLPGLRNRLLGEADRWHQALASGDASIANAFVGEAVGLIHDIRPSAAIIEMIVNQAVENLSILCQQQKDWNRPLQHGQR